MDMNVEKDVCFVCSRRFTSCTEQTGNLSISRHSSVREFTDALFVVSNVFDIPAERIENLMIHFIAGRTKAEVEAGCVEKLICDFCSVSIAKIVDVYKEILETSEEIEHVETKLIPGNKRRRKIKILCDEEHVTPTNDGARAFPCDPESNADDCEMEEAEAFSPGGDLAAESCPPDDDGDPPPKQLKARRSRGTRPLDYNPKKKRGKHSKKVTCPFCQNLSQTSSKAVQLCKHLQECSSAQSNSDQITLTCVTCNVFQSSDFLLFCEHFEACAGPGEGATQVVPIQNRLISCDCCPLPNCFKFEDYLQHYLYHQKNPMKCIHPLKSGVTCLSRWDCRTSYCAHWRKCHRGQPDRLPRPKSYILDNTLPSIPYFCHLCNARFESRHLRDEHLTAIHSLPRNPPNPATCPHCGFAAHLAEDVSTHVVTEHPLLVNHKCGKRRVRSCDLCDHHFPSKLALTRHKRLVHLIQPPKMPKQPRKLRHGCPDCGKRYNESNQLVSHRIREHNATDLGPDPNQCSICKAPLAGQYSLKLHLSNVHGKKPPDKSCHHCGKMLTSCQALNRHLFVFHGEGSLREFKCPWEGCSKSYAGIGSLKIHEALFHLKTPLFNCEICGKGYYGKQRLNRHLLYHKYPNFRPFSCDMCPSKTYRTPYELGLHWKSGHSKEARAELEKAGVREEQLKEFLRVVKEAGLEWNTKVPISID